MRASLEPPPHYSLEAAERDVVNPDEISSSTPSRLPPVSVDQDILAFPAVSPVRTLTKDPLILETIQPQLPPDEPSSRNASSSSLIADNGSDTAYDSIDEVRSSGSAEIDSTPFNEDSDNDVNWLNQPKSPQNKLFETLKIQMEQTDFSSSTKNDAYTDSRFIDAPIPLMDFPATPINREWEVRMREISPTK